MGCNDLVQPDQLPGGDALNTDIEPLDIETVGRNVAAFSRSFPTADDMGKGIVEAIRGLPTADEMGRHLVDISPHVIGECEAYCKYCGPEQSMFDEQLDIMRVPPVSYQEVTQ